MEGGRSLVLRGVPHWVYGAEARHRFFRWAGIPREIVKKFDAERQTPPAEAERVSGSAKDQAD
jgi:hypothetical protein